MADRDYYNVLGVPRNAGADEIKKAYRSLAMRWHPDRNTGDPVAEVRFKHVNEAYRVLSDAEERARYDRMGPLFQPDGQQPTPDDVSTVMNRMWDNLFGRRRNTPGDDLRYTVSVTLEEVATGAQKDVVVPRKVRCDDCRGLGASAEGREVCPICQGTGRSTGARLLRMRCYHCDGQGFVIKAPCKTCSGDGVVGREESLKVKVPPGVATGVRLKVTGKGNDPVGDGTTGDLYVLVDVPDHRLFRRRGDDLLVEVPVTLRDAAIGADVVVPTVDGTTTVRIPAGTQHGQQLRLAGRGLPRYRGAGRGDLHLEVQVEVPASLTDAERARLAAFVESLPADRHPRRAAFERAVQERR